MTFTPHVSLHTLGSAAFGLLRAVSSRPLASAEQSFSDRSELAAYVAKLALEAGFVATEVELHEDDIESLLSGDAPFIVVPFPERDAAYVAVSGGRRVRLLPARGEPVDVSAEELRSAVLEPSRERACEATSRLIDGAAGEQLSRVVSDELFAAAPVAWGFVFRPEVQDSLPGILDALGARRCAAKLLALAATESSLTLLSFWLVGSVALAGHADRGSLLGWGLLSLTAACLKLWSTRTLGRFTLRAATRARQRLLRGVLQLDPDTLGGRGLGGLLVTAAQADSLVGAALVLGFAALGAVVNLVGAISVLVATPSPGLGLMLLVAGLAAVACAFPRTLRLYSEDQAERMRLTTETIERLVGHRTRLVQQAPNAWHDGEDESVLGYAAHSRALDRHRVMLRSVPRAYALSAIAVVFLVLVAHPTPLTLALSFGAMTLGALALAGVVEVALTSASLLAVWRSVRPLVQDDGGDIRWTSAAPCEPISPGGAVMELRGVCFGYPTRHKPILDEANMTVRDGDRVLVEGRSGGGKTTLAALLTGLRKPTHGLVFSQGLDQHTVGELDLRRSVAAAPQFYKNHVFTDSLAYNLLLGRAWPPSADDLEQADCIARELGLGPLLDRMPAGLFQHVGETGWQLSHGEKSRVFLARALLQRANVVVLDETFGALDPATLEQCMRVVHARARTLVVITHR